MCIHEMDCRKLFLPKPLFVLFNDYTKLSNYLQKAIMRALKRIISVLCLFLILTNVRALGDEGRSAHDGTLRRIRVPILMYHYISPLPPEADDIRIELTVEPHIFRSHLEHLKTNGYSSISLYELDRALLMGTPLPEKPVILTFDDGHIDHYTHAYPMLKEFGFSGTFFIITSFADHNAQNYLNWGQIVEMSANGMSMEAHTKSHQDLRNRDRDYLIYEIFGSLESLEAHTKLPTRMFAYPGGKYDSAVLSLARDLPVWRAVTTENNAFHTTDNDLEMTRLRVSGNMSVIGLDAMLRSN
jgi:peptidoglycan/xylan/chitin deacetylase (PgdA/CDA1 family)